MGRYTGPKRRLSRREGVALFSKDAAFIDRKGALPPGQHGLRTRRRVSEYGIQLREKQKAKRMYGLMERQFAKYYQIASSRKGNRGVALLELHKHHTYLGVTVLLFGGVVAVMGYRRFQKADRAIRSHKLPPTGIGPGLQVLSVVIAAVVLAVAQFTFLH